MRIKRTILAPVVLALGSIGVMAGTVAPIVAASASVGSVAVASASPDTGVYMG